MTIKRTLLFISIACICLCSCSDGQEKAKTILVIFAHSDEETAMGQVLAKYSAHNKIHILYVVDDADTSGHDLTADGDSINHIHIAESKAACEMLGVTPTYMGFGRLDGRWGPKVYFQKIKKLRTALTKKMEEINPDVIITFGPDGESGHYEHRIVGSMVTELILYNGWVERFPLYYYAFPKEERAKELLEGTGEVDRKYLTVIISYSDADEVRAIESWACHKSQYDKETKELTDSLIADKSNLFYFRQFTVTSKKKTDLFEK